MRERTFNPIQSGASFAAHQRAHPHTHQRAHTHAHQRDVLFGCAVTVDRARGELYTFWRNFTNLPRFMHDLHRVAVIDSRRSHWVVAAAAGKTIEWDCEITEDDPDRLIAWKSSAGARVHSDGRVELRDSPDGRGTVVIATLSYDVPAGAAGNQALRHLRRFKQLMETGEVSTALRSRPCEH